MDRDRRGLTPYGGGAMGGPGGRGSLWDLRREMDRMFEDFWRGMGPSTVPGASEGHGVMSVDIDVTEDDKAYHVTAELPGIDEKDLDVSIADNVLTIRGEKRSEYDDRSENRHFHLVERSYGSFERSFRLDENVEEDKIKANFRNGVLRIDIPKNERAKSKTKKIDIGH